MLKFLAKGRTDQIFISELVARYWMLKNPRYRVLEFGDVIEDEEIMLEVHPDKAHLLERIDAGLRQMLETREIEKIYRNYGWNGVGPP